MPGGKKKKAVKPSAKSRPDPARKKGPVKSHKPSAGSSTKTGVGDSKYRTLVENSPVCIHEINLDGALMSMNAAGLAMMGVRDENEIVGMAYLDSINDDERGRIEGLLAQAYGGRSSHFEFIASGADPRIFSSCFIPIKSKKGKVAWLMGITEDITERRKAEEALKESEEKYRALMDNAGDAIVINNLEGKIVEANQKAGELIGFSSEELIGSSFTRFVPEDKIEKALESFYKTIEKGKGRVIEGVLLRKDGSTVPVEMSGAVIEHAGKKVVQGIFRDITERKQADEALQDALEFRRKIIAKSPVGIVIYDESGQCVDVNESLAKIVGATKEQILQQNYHHLDTWKKSGLYEKAVSAIEENSIKRYDAPMKTTFGKDVTLDCYLVPFMSAGKNQLMVMLTDITEKKKTEEALREAKEKAEEATKEKDKYISLIAHNLKSPFTSIVTLLELLSSEKNDPAIIKHRMLIDAVRDTSEYAMKVIDDVLRVSRFESGKIQLNPGFMDGNIEVIAVIATHGHLAHEKGIKLVNKVPQNTRLYADCSLFREVLSNLAYNAIKFCARDDTIIFYVPSGERSTLAIQDTGAGMDKCTLSNIFRHDVKTTSLGTAGEKGTGIGLPFCAGIMKEHGGELAAESVKGGGSVFYARLPYVKPTALIVEGDTVVRRTLEKQLEKIDMNVVKAKNTEGVFKALKKDSPHLILLDIHLQNDEGFVILKRLKADKVIRDIPVIIVMSGDRTVAREKAISLGADDFIFKPVKPEEFIPRVRKFVV